VEQILAILESPRHWRSPASIWGIFLAVATSSSLVVWLTGISPWPLLVVATFCVTLGIAQISNLRVGFSGAVVTLLALYSVFIRLTPRLGLGLALPSGVALLFAATLGIITIQKAAIPRLPTAPITVFSAGLVLCALIIAAILIPARSNAGMGPPSLVMI